MYEERDFCDLPHVYARAEPDDEYDPLPDPLDPRLIDDDENDLHEEEDEDEEDI